MYVECTNNNPIVRTFVAQLQDSLVHKSTSNLSNGSYSGSDNGLYQPVNGTVYIAIVCK